MSDSNPHDYREAYSARAGGLTPVRAQAFEAFEATGFPTRQLEEWRYTNPAPITRVAWQFPNDAPVDLPADFANALPDFGASRLVFVDGRFNDAASRIDDAAAFEFNSLGTASLEALPGYADLAESKDHGFTAFNTAFATDGVALRFTASDEASTPVHVVFATRSRTADSASFPRLWIRAEERSRGRVIVDHVSVDATPATKQLTCSVAEIFVGEAASLDVTVVQREAESAFHVARHTASQERDSTLRFQTLTLTGALVRNDLEVKLAGPGAACHLDGLYLGRNDQLVDNHTLVDHAVPHCDSHERYKGIVTDKARGVFRGRVLVRPDAQQTNAVQQNANLILTAGAEIDTKPQLEIYADDVACSHGSSIGKLDEEALFFLRARGLDPAFARRLLMSGFAAEITQSISHDGVRAWLDDVVSQRLDGLMGGNAPR